MHRRADGLGQKHGLALLDAVRRARPFEETRLIQAAHERPKLTFGDACAAQEQRRGELCQRAAAVQQHQHFGRAVGNDDRVDVRIGRVAQHQAASAAVFVWKDFDRPQSRIFS